MAHQYSTYTLTPDQAFYGRGKSVRQASQPGLIFSEDYGNEMLLYFDSAPSKPNGKVRRIVIGYQRSNDFPEGNPTALRYHPVPESEQWQIRSRFRDYEVEF